jgi:hypothetical protein
MLSKRRVKDATATDNQPRGVVQPTLILNTNSCSALYHTSRAMIFTLFRWSFLLLVLLTNLVSAQFQFFDNMFHRQHQEQQRPSADAQFAAYLESGKSIYFRRLQKKLMSPQSILLAVPMPSYSALCKISRRLSLSSHRRYQMHHTR